MKSKLIRKDQKDDVAAELTKKFSNAIDLHIQIYRNKKRYADPTPEPDDLPGMVKPEFKVKQ